MRKLRLLFLLFILPCSLCPTRATPSATPSAPPATLTTATLTTASAESSTYACVLSKETFLYAEQNENTGLFLIPCTYYVRVTAMGSEFCAVEYQTNSAEYRAVQGYCKTNELHFVDFTPVRPFVYYTLDLTYRLADGGSVLTGENMLTEWTVRAAWYGEYKIGSAVFYYVYANNQFGYVPKTEEVYFEQNTDYEPSSPTNGSAEQSETETDFFRVVVIVSLVAFALGLIYIIFRPGNKPHLPDEDE